MKTLTKERDEHSFSIEMDSKKNLSHVSLSDKSSDGVLIKGKLGELTGITLHEGVMLEVQGEKGVLRLDLSYDELFKVIEKNRKTGGN